MRRSVSIAVLTVALATGVGTITVGQKNNSAKSFDRFLHFAGRRGGRKRADGFRTEPYRLVAVVHDATDDKDSDCSRDEKKPAKKPASKASKLGSALRRKKKTEE